jgi:hypothetical protein
VRKADGNASKPELRFVEAPNVGHQPQITIEVESDG